jgi:hypothetical protein
MKYKIILQETNMVTYEIEEVDKKSAITEAFSGQGKIDERPLDTILFSIEEIK